MSLLDEECVFPQGTDMSFLAKLNRYFICCVPFTTESLRLTFCTDYRQCNGHQYYHTSAKGAQNTFTMEHYAGTVKIHLTPRCLHPRDKINQNYHTRWATRSIHFWTRTRISCPTIWRLCYSHHQIPLLANSFHKTLYSQSNALLQPVYSSGWVSRCQTGIWFIAYFLFLFSMQNQVTALVATWVFLNIILYLISSFKQSSPYFHSLRSCTPHYIRCIRPNATKSPNKVDDQLLTNQIRYLGNSQLSGTNIYSIVWLMINSPFRFARKRACAESRLCLQAGLC